jgi:hypothetical protein
MGFEMWEKYSPKQLKLYDGINNNYQCDRCNILESYMQIVGWFESISLSDLKKKKGYVYQCPICGDLFGWHDALVCERTAKVHNTMACEEFKSVHRN